ncbi:MAG TPA: nucleoside/nucleotide kinase family protein [Micromonosporaceae bacterium]|nr:nucleoside/nucleotide kinase family protein [Micromonosporaceae bacterium]
MATSHPSLVAAARDAVEPLLRTDRTRILVGIAGPPAAGKSTLAQTLAGALCAAHGPDTAVAIGMDGFHLANSELARLGLAARKGAPDTFDAAGFVAMLRRLRSDEAVVYTPVYSRVLHESIGGVVPVPASVRVVVVEGNYLLLPHEPWSQARELLDLVCYLDAPTDARVESLLRRQRMRGLDRGAAMDWVHGSDEVNAELIATTRARADVILARPR